jgi:hypothetical protein
MTAPLRQKLAPSVRLATYAALGVSLSVLFALRHSTNVRSGVWLWILQSDFGNALAALVAVGGYMLDHWNQRKSQQLEAQMQRVTAQSQEFLVPVTTQCHALFLGSMLHFVDKHMSSTAYLMETEYGDANYSSHLLKEYLRTPVLEMPTELTNPSSVAFIALEILMKERKGKSSNDESRVGIAPKITSPRELPKFLHTAVENCDRPNSKLWKSYEAFVRHEFVPAVNRIAELIDEHGHLMASICPKRLAQMFDSTGTGHGKKWEIAPRMWFYSMWLAYAKSWQTLLAMWDAGVYDEIRPSTIFPVGMLFFNIEAQTNVASVENQLIGMSQMHLQDPNKFDKAFAS